MVLTCTGVSFFHGSNDGQKGMGLIMLILIGTVPTAYALNHAVSPMEVQQFIAASQQAGQILDRHVSPDRSSAPTRAPRSRPTSAPSNFSPQPFRLSAIWWRTWTAKLCFTKSSNRFRQQDQSNIRNDMYLASEALRQMQKEP